MKKSINDVWVELKPSSFLKGEVGLFAVRNIKKGQKILNDLEEKEGFLTTEEYSSLPTETQNKVKMFMVGRPGGFLFEEGLDFNNIGISYFINHSCLGNLGFDKDGDFMALRDINKGEEFSYDYGLLEAGPDFVLLCKCDTSVCRKKITGMDWKNKEFREKNLEYMYPDLRIETE